ncbi:MAG: serine/threonine protein kinase, partial [Thermoguttaceae bacterium]|nr:serine/threonine protein kinase [Thermoguttaceae bacterium]
MGAFDFVKKVMPKRLKIQDRFHVRKEMISGTMSKFYMVEDKVTGETFGLKVLDKEKTKQFEDRFKVLKVKKPSEGEIAMKFDNPYIAKTLEIGTTDHGEPYLLMEYLHGTGLNNILLVKQDLLAGGRMRYIRQCAEALAHVHSRGFIHRDYCPRNLMFTGDGTALKLIDFGLSVPNQPPFTDAGNRTGTPAYMAPELIRRHPTSEKLDVFSFGVTMYELCTRQLPWPTASRGGLAAMSHDQPAT